MKNYVKLESPPIGLGTKCSILNTVRRMNFTINSTKQLKRLVGVELKPPHTVYKIYS